jgi:hypothetical protein
MIVLDTNNEIDTECARCRLPRSEWGENGMGYPKLERQYCCRGCADGGACTCLEAGPAA